MSSRPALSKLCQKLSIHKCIPRPKIIIIKIIIKCQRQQHEPRQQQQEDHQEPRKYQEKEPQQ